MKTAKYTVKLLAHDDEINHVKTATYLRDILNEDGFIDDIVKARKDKSIGRISKISSILGTSISLGMFYVDISLILRDFMLLNPFQTNLFFKYELPGGGGLYGPRSVFNFGSPLNLNFFVFVLSA
jgi:hypothetical protein